jgi:AcrR family transcriptional regulator
VADVATVFNYFKTKEDLFFDRQDVAVQSLGRVVASRRAGESVVEALRRDFHEVLDERDWRYGIVNGADEFSRMVVDSPALLARMREMHDLRKEYLAQVLAEETDADPDDPTPRFVAAQVVALTHAISAKYLRRRRGGESHAAILPAVRAAVDQGFDLLKSGIGNYPG